MTSGMSLRKKTKRKKVCFSVEIGLKLLFLFMTYTVHLLLPLELTIPKTYTHTRCHGFVTYLNNTFS